MEVHRILSPKLDIYCECSIRSVPLRKKRPPPLKVSMLIEKNKVYFSSTCTREHNMLEACITPVILHVSVRTSVPSYHSISPLFNI